MKRKLVGGLISLSVILCLMTGVAFANEEKLSTAYEDALNVEVETPIKPQGPWHPWEYQPY